MSIETTISSLAGLLLVGFCAFAIYLPVQTL